MKLILFSAIVAILWVGGISIYIGFFVIPKERSLLYMMWQDIKRKLFNQ